MAERNEKAAHGSSRDLRPNCQQVCIGLVVTPGSFPIVFAQGFVVTLFFGWLPPHPPELSPTRVRATGSGIAFNVGRFATAGGVLAARLLFTALGRSYPAVGAVGAMIYALGMIVIWWAPDTAGKSLDD